MRIVAFVFSALLCIASAYGESRSRQSGPEPTTHPELVDAPKEIIRGFHYIQSARPEWALDIAVRILQVDPTSLAAHRLYIYAMLEHRQADLVLKLYQDWYEQNPKDEIRRISLIWAWMARQNEPGSWCDELETLLQPRPQSGSARYWHHRAQFEASKDCYIDGTVSRAALIAIGSEVEEAWGYRLRLKLTEQFEIDAKLAAETLSFAKAYPNRLAYLPNIWSSRYSGSHLEETREGIITIAKEAAKGRDDVEVYEAALVLKRAGLDEDSDAAFAHLKVIDPDHTKRKTKTTTGNRGFFAVRPQDRVTKDEIKVIKLAETQHRRELLRNLRVLDKELPPNGLARSKWWEAKAKAEEELGRVEEAVESRRQAWLSLPPDNPNKGRAANQYAWAAVLIGKDLERALDAINSALEQPATYDHRSVYYLGRDYEAWLLEQRKRTAAWLDTKGWILAKLNRLEQAKAVLQQAVFMRPTPTAELYLHLGLVQAQLNENDAALLSLSRGLSIATPTAPLTLEARDIAEELLVNRGWSGHGLDGWIRAHAPSEPNNETAESSIVDYRIGKQFPDLDILIDGETVKLSSIQGIRVVDLWASWCGPCVLALPHLNEMAQQYQAQGVSVIALSVEDEFARSKKKLKEELDDIHFTSAWVGPSGQSQAHVRAIPAVFVLDSDMKIIGFVRGYRPNDSRVEAILDEHLTSKTELNKAAGE